MSEETFGRACRPTEILRRPLHQRRAKEGMEEVGLPSRMHQLNVYFRNPEYLAYLQGQLRASNVLDYFATSEFYEQGCNNALLRQQGLQLDGVQDDAEAMARLEAGLKRLVGIEYVVAHARTPDLFVIHKRQRSGPEDVRVIEAYYVLHGDIRMAADLYTLLGSRLVSLRCIKMQEGEERGKREEKTRKEQALIPSCQQLSTLSSLQTSMGLARRAQERFSPRQGHAWRVLAESAENGEEEEGSHAEDDAVGSKEGGALVDANVAAIASVGQEGGG